MPGEYRQWLDLDLYINGELQFCGEDAPFSSPRKPWRLPNRPAAT
jgi:hypothetical protein